MRSDSLLDDLKAALADRLREIANLVDNEAAYQAIHDIADQLDGEEPT